jgi:outer membrane lipoprotein-sorting protein
MVSVSAGAQDTIRQSDDNGALPLIDSIVAAQTSARSVAAKYHHKQWLNDAAPAEYQGDISYLAPEKILMHFLFPADEYVLVDDSVVLIYGVKSEYGMRYSKKCLSPAERQISDQIGQIRMNLLATMRSTYFFSVVDGADPSNTIITARPKGGWKALGKITIAVDGKKRVLKSIELYAKEGPLVSSTNYADFIRVKETGNFFPRSITTVLNAGGMKRKDEISYSRVEFNKPFPDNHFTVAVSKHAKIVDNLDQCKK